MNTLMQWARNLLVVLCWGLLTQCAPPPAQLPLATPSPPPPATPTPQAVLLPQTTYYASADYTYIVRTTHTHTQSLRIPNGVRQLIASDTRLAIRDQDDEVSLIDVTTQRRTPLDLPCTDIAWHDDVDTVWCVAYANLYALSPAHRTLVTLAPPDQRIVRVIPQPTQPLPWLIIADSTGNTRLCTLVNQLTCVSVATDARWNSDGTRVAVRTDDIQPILVLDAMGKMIDEITVADIEYVTWLDTTTLFVRTKQHTFSYALLTQTLTDTSLQIAAPLLLAVE